MGSTAHTDSFARDNLPPREQWPELIFDLPELRYPGRLNCATELLDRAIGRGWGGRVALRSPEGELAYAQLLDQSNRIARVLTEDMGLATGNRVLLRGANSPWMAACWFAVMKAGGIAVATMPLLRAKELGEIIDKAQVTHALCDRALADELFIAAGRHSVLRQMLCFRDDGERSLEAAMARQPAHFTNVDTAADDTCVIAFTSGTTGVPKGTMHFHRDILAACVCWPRHVLRVDAEDVFIGSPPLAFTFGLGGLVLFPMSVGACTVLLEKAGPAALLDAVPEFGATVLFTAPTSYRGMAEEAGRRRLSQPQGGSLRKCISAGEFLPA